MPQVVNDASTGDRCAGISKSSSMTGSTVSFHNINYVVKTTENRKKVNKFILQNINGVFEPGMNAILGPTGSGKTSLLDVLAARKDPTGLSGDVLIDGYTQPRNFKCVSGYVVQDDVVMGTLTIRENLSFSAALRLPKTVNKRERGDRVIDIIKELGLNHVADSKVGTEFIRGVSGGERKRTNVGMELIIKPTVLFLDEPTTGLDASTANAVMHLLAKLSLGGRTMIFSIHQPRYSIFRLFDKMHLLGRGQTIYHGPAQEALQYFSSIGFDCEKHNNPPDFFLDVITGDHSSTRFSKNETNGDVGAGAAEKGGDLDELVQSFRKSAHHQQMTEATHQIYSKFTGEKNEAAIASIDYPTPFRTQLYHVSARAVLNILRNPFLTFIQNSSTIMFALIIGGIYFDLDNSLASGYQNRIGAFFFLIMQVVFQNLSAVQLFIDERVIFVHESASGFYRVSAYFLAKVFCDIIPLRVVPTVIYSVITYWMIGLQSSAAQFFIYFMTLLLVTLVSSAIAFAISSSVSIAGIATLLIAGLYVIMMIFGGLLVNISSLPVWLQWLQYLSIFRYGLNALLINEIKDTAFCEDVAEQTGCIPGTVYLNEQGIDYSVWGLWQNEMALGIMTVGLLVIGYIQLWRMPKLK
ncbi:broad substrate specificity ATP-binding cassette transporter ABCG2-like [Diadema antillarum]|uniref:broad substrate specificity ATP-binding cassette transporter ABCG2-like n=1 Tax=Diadema antillarum TaxID=105358 RepID=UPI003A887BBA